MRKKGPKIKDLAKEIGVSSNTLMLKCREAGIFAQNSVTRIEPNLVPAIKAWFEPESQPPTPDPAATCDRPRVEDQD
ncbi:MAG: hypothetical protein ACYTHJ_20285 [Planctomycetota bacterium]|jgi:hypothetical protein